MRQGFQKVLETKPPRGVHTPLEAFVLGIHSLEGVIPWQKSEPKEN